VHRGGVESDWGVVVRALIQRFGLYPLPAVCLGLRLDWVQI
jgi:hypothetical protein